MAGLKIQGFAGIVPKHSSHLLQDNEAQTASNTKLLSGEIRSWHKPGNLSPRIIPAAVPSSIYRMNGMSDDSLWLTWGSDVDVVPGPIYDSGSPVYYTGDGLPKKTNVTMASSTNVSSPSSGEHPRDYLLMGVPTPSVAPAVVTSGGAAVTGSSSENRVYLYTYISVFGTIVEESAPSPTSAQVVVLPGGTVTVSGLPSAAPAGKYNITKVRVYRSITGTASTIFMKVADVAIGTTSLYDNVSAASLGVVLPSTTWGPPPDGLTGLTGMANGIMAGFVGNQIYFSEPFKPHAWPAEYGLSVEFPVVGLAAYGSSLVVGTKGNPFIISGTNPASMSQEKLPLYEPCMSKRSIASDEMGAMYASPNGIVKIGPGIADNITRKLFGRDEWSKYIPSSMIGEVHDGRYFLFWKGIDDLGGGLILDRNSEFSPLSTTTVMVTAMHTDPVNANLFIVEDGEIRGWDSDVVNDLKYEWRSKVFTMPRPLNFGSAQVSANFADQSALDRLKALIVLIKAKNLAIWNGASNLFGALGASGLNEQTLDGSSLIDIPITKENLFVLLSVYADGVLRAQVQILDERAVRLPSGFKATNWEFVINGNVSVRYLKVAETSKELAGI